MTHYYYIIGHHHAWLTMTPLTDPLEDEVRFFAIDADNEDHFYECTQAGDGALLGTVTIVDGQPQLTLPAPEG